MTRNRPHRIRLRGLALTGLLLIGACRDVGPTEGDVGVDSSLLTPEAVATLDARRFFPAQEPEPGYTRPRSRRVAEDMVMENLDRLWASQRRHWEGQHGSTIRVGELRRCGRTLYASSSYDLSLMDADQTERQALGGRYLITLCSARGEPQLLVGVPVEPNFLAESLEAQLGSFWGAGIPIENRGQAFVSAEQAVRIAAARTNRRVRATPELIIPRWGMHWPRWRVELESPVPVAGARTMEVDTISFVMVGIDPWDESQSWSIRAMRPRFRATADVRVDTIGPTDDPRSRYHARLGMPLGVEPFGLPFP
jgi:hypothetical protein